MNTSADRSALRQSLRKQRSALAPESILAGSRSAAERLEELPVIVNARAIAGYAGTRGEIDVFATLEAARRRGAVVALPRLDPTAGRDPFEMVLVAWDPGEPLVSGPWSIRQPPQDGRSPLSPDAFDVILTPAVGVDAHGTRLGMGGGYYDRWLATGTDATRPLVIALVHDFQVVDIVPKEPWDRPVHLVVTPTRVLYCTP